MRTLLRGARLILPDAIREGSLLVEDGIIARVGAHEETADQVMDLHGAYLAPGFVEIHTHGGGGGDFMDGTVDAYRRACQCHLHHGTTTIYPTLLAASEGELRQSLDAFVRALPELEKAGITAPGVHLEGPYLNREQKGAINDRYIRDPDPGEYMPFLEEYGSLVARWTVAPELPGALELGETLKQRGILVSMGHSQAVYSQVVDALEHGFSHVTHLYSAMSTIVRRGGFRYPGVLESAFCLPRLTVEIIADGCHLPPELLKMVYDLMGSERVALTCDSMRCAGQTVGSSYLGSRESGIAVIIEDGVAKLADRSAFAGSVATDDRLVRTMVQKAGVPLQEAVKMMTLTPARIMGIAGRKGSLAPGKDADLVILDDALEVQGVFAMGRQVFSSAPKNDL